MRTTLIVDGYNAINAIPETRKKLKDGLLDARSLLIVMTREYVRSSGYIDDFCVVFDGQDRYRHLDRLIPRGGGQVFSRTGLGDEKIIDTVKRYSEKNRVIVASDDNFIKNMSRGYRASVISPEDLAGKKKKLRTKNKNEEKHPDKKIGKKLRDSITEEYKRQLGL